MADEQFNAFINQTDASASGNGSELGDLVTGYDDFLRGVTAWNWSDLIPPVAPEDRDRLLTLIRQNVDPSLWCDWKSMLNVTSNTSTLQCNTSTTSVTSNFNSFWEAGKVRIPLYRWIALRKYALMCTFPPRCFAVRFSKVNLTRTLNELRATFEPVNE